MGNLLRRTTSVLALGLATTLAVTGATSVTAAHAGPAVVMDNGGDVQPLKKGTKRVVFVGNNWEGTADIVNPQPFRKIGQINVIPDHAQRMQEIATNPYRLAYFLAIRALIGEGNDQFVDDMYSSNDGKTMVVSRPSFADVVGINLKTRKIKWRFQVAGVRSDHMAVHPNGKYVVVSASTGNVVHVLRMSDGKQLWKFKSGGSPHESIFLDGGKRILHASIGMVYSPLDRPELDATKQERVLQIVNTKTRKIERRYNLRKALDAVGMPDTSIAVRPLTVSPDQKKFYFQLSFFHGFVELDRRSGKITRVKRLPNLIKTTPREFYLLDSAHHGIAMNPKGTRMCVAGTMSDYATVVNAKTLKQHKLIKKGLKPYWVTPSANGKYCYISWSGSDKISRIIYSKARLPKRGGTVRVGDHPQRIRNALIKTSYLKGLKRIRGTVPRRTSEVTPWEKPSDYTR